MIITICLRLLIGFSSLFASQEDIPAGKRWKHLPFELTDKTWKQLPFETANKPWKQLPFELTDKSIRTYNISQYQRPWISEKNCFINIAPELEGLKAIETSGFQTKIILKQPSKLLIGVFRDSASREPAILPGGQLIIKNALTVSGMPAVDVYAKTFQKGIVEITTGEKKQLLLGVLDPKETLVSKNAAMHDGRYWKPFIVEGFTAEKPLFEVLAGPDTPVIAEGMPGTEDIQGGFEGGAAVKINGMYHLFPTERAGEKGMPAYYDRVKTRIGHWTSTDGIKWKRENAIYNASGTYAISREDNPMNDRRAAIWSYMPIFNKKANRWYGYYLAYTVDKELSPNHSFGRIWRCESEKPGIEGIGGPYKDMAIIMEPGFDSQLWEGRQGVDSFYPFETKDGWLAFYGGAYPYLNRADYPSTMGSGWYVGLAKSKSPEGPWTRMDEKINPVTSIHPSFIENPIVYQLPGGKFITIFDGGPEGWGHHLPNMMGYALSSDGITWQEAHYIPIHTKVKKWWDIMRTPVCLIPESDNEYTVFYAAIDTTQRFHPMGMVKLKLNPEVLK